MVRKRYIRQIALDKIGELGQEKLLKAHIVVVGCGGLGSIAAPYLAGAGIGKITLIDGDTPEISNLHRQVFFTSNRTTFHKSELLANHITQLNPDIVVNVIKKMVIKENISEIINSPDIVLECTDNIQCKYLVNDYCNINQIPLIYGAIYKYDGYVSTFLNKTDSDIHLRDIFRNPNQNIPSCSEVGVMGTLAGIIGILQANEAIKMLCNCGPLLAGQLLTYNILTNEQFKLKLKKTYKNNLKEVYIESSYDQMSCEAPLVSLEEVVQYPERYRLVSILNDDEHEALTSTNCRESQDNIDPEKWSPKDQRITVFYCLTGVRSATVVNKIRAAQPDLEVKSLEGGLSKNRS